MVAISQRQTARTDAAAARGGTGESAAFILGDNGGFFVFNMLHSLYPDVTLEEVQAYVADVWDTI